MDVRAKLYELLSHCIPPTVVMKVRSFNCRESNSRQLKEFLQTIAERLLQVVDDSLKPDIMHWAAVYVSHICPANYD